MDIENYLDRLDAFHALSPGLRAYLKTIVKEERFEKGSRILLSEGKLNFYPFLTQGSLKLMVTDQQSSEETNLLFCFEDEFFHHYNQFYIDQNRKLVVEFLQETRLLSINEAHYANIQKLFHETYRLNLSFNANQMGNLIYHLYIRNTFRAKDRYKMSLKKYPKLGTRISVKDMATFLGVDQKTLSRLRSEI